MPQQSTPDTMQNLEQRLGEALKRKFEKFNPAGERIGDTPWVADIVLDTEQPKVIYHFEDRYWLAPFLRNADGSVGLGDSIETQPSWSILAEAPALRRQMKAVITSQISPWRNPEDRDPKIFFIAASEVFAAFGGALYRWPYRISAGRVELGSHQIVDIETQTVQTLAAGIQLDAEQRGIRMSDAEARREARARFDAATPRQRERLPLFMPAILAEAVRRGGAA